MYLNHIQEILWACPILIAYLHTLGMLSAIYISRIPNKHYFESEKCRHMGWQIIAILLSKQLLTLMSRIC